jgi:GT2 family glycosyltransferase
MKNVTAIIISFLRPTYAIGCIESLKCVYPDINVIVGENGEYNNELAEVCRKHGARYIELPFDSGVCVGRNTLMKHVETEYVLVGDDDFFYDETTGVDHMRLLL